MWIKVQLTICWQAWGYEEREAQRHRGTEAQSGKTSMLDTKYINATHFPYRIKLIFRIASKDFVPLCLCAFVPLDMSSYVEFTFVRRENANTSVVGIRGVKED